MDHATLVGFDIEGGDTVIAALDRAGFKPHVAIWTVLEEYGDPRLVLASRKFDQKSLRKADEEVLAALRKEHIDFHRLPSILILRMTDKFIQALRERFAKIENVRGVRLDSQLVGSRYLEEGYIYRIS